MKLVCPLYRWWEACSLSWFVVPSVPSSFSRLFSLRCGVLISNKLECSFLMMHYRSSMNIYTLNHLLLTSLIFKPDPYLRSGWVNVSINESEKENQTFMQILRCRSIQLFFLNSLHSTQLKNLFMNLKTFFVEVQIDFFLKKYLKYISFSTIMNKQS